MKCAQQFVFLGHRALALVHLDQHARLIVGMGGEYLCLLGGRGSVAWNKGGHVNPGGFQAQ